MHTPKMRTERLLATVRVRREYIECPADAVWFGLKNIYAPDVVVLLYWQQDFRNPIITSRFPGITLRAALEDVARFCGVAMSITDQGQIVLAVPHHVENMKHAVVIEPSSNWTAVHNVQKELERVSRKQP